MISFRCKNCNQKIRTSEANAGKKGKCPKCKQAVVIPSAVEKAAPPVDPVLVLQATSAGGADPAECTMCGHKIAIPQGMEGQLVECTQCGCFVDTSPEPAAAEQIDKEQLDYSQQADTSDQLDYLIQDRIDREGKKKKTSKSKLPWFIDTFLYPLNVPGLIMWSIFALTPIVLHGIALLLIHLLGDLALLIIFVAPVFWLIRAFIWLYMFSYFVICVQESADGNTRAVETLTRSDDEGIGQLFGNMFRILIGVMLCMGPAIAYYANTRQSTPVFWLILGCGTFFLPMALLSVSMYESLGGLNPFIIIISIIKRFFSYLALLPVVYTVIGLIAMEVVVGPKVNPVIPIIFRLTAIYMYLVLANLLGRFYHRNEHALDWSC